MKQPQRRIAESVLANIRAFEHDCSCENCAAGKPCIECPQCIEQMSETLGQLLGFGPAAVVTQRSLPFGQVIEFRPREKKPCQGISDPGERKA